MAKKKTENTKLKVLYQNLNGKWYAFTNLGEEIYFGAVPMEGAPIDADQASNKRKKAPPRAKKSVSRSA